MSDDDNDPRLIRAQHELLRRLGTLINDQPELDQSLLDKMYNTIKDHRDECLNLGFKFPQLVPIAVIGSGCVDFVRADLDMSSIKTKILNYVREHPNVSMENVVAGFRIAFPQLRPDDILEKREVALQANERMIERAKEFVSQEQPDGPQDVIDLVMGKSPFQGDEGE